MSSATATTTPASELNATYRPSAEGHTFKKHLEENLKWVNSYANTFTPKAFYSNVQPTPLPNPHLVHFNTDLAKAALDFEEQVDEKVKKDIVDLFSGNLLPKGSSPIATLYCGHQFGYLSNPLGDGRAILLGEVVNSKGDHWDIQVKGSGKTPYSRFGDGLAVLRSVVREYLCSEAMYHLGIPTTRALAITGSTDKKVYRETIETAAMMVRMAPSHLRFGTFEVFFYRQQFDNLKKMADYAIENFFPHIPLKTNKSLNATVESSTSSETSSHFDPANYIELLREVVIRTARLVAKWQSVGWTHGVLNTDNMSVLGLTIDYGPFGFINDFDPNYIPNHSDETGRYAYDQQPNIGYWNLHKLSIALSPLIPKEELKNALDLYVPTYQAHYGELMRAKVGFQTQQEEDDVLLDELLDLLYSHQVDYTIFFRKLAVFELGKGAESEANREITALFKVAAPWDEWAKKYEARLQKEKSVDAERKEKMNKVNPKFILRQHLAQKAIADAQSGDFAEVDKLFKILQKPFEEQPEHEEYASRPPEWGQNLQCSCSS